jgi:hypothetical protein
LIVAFAPVFNLQRLRRPAKEVHTQIPESFSLLADEIEMLGCPLSTFVGGYVIHGALLLGSHLSVPPHRSVTLSERTGVQEKVPGGLVTGLLPLLCLGACVFLDCLIAASNYGHTISDDPGRIGSRLTSRSPEVPHLRSRTCAFPEHSGGPLATAAIIHHLIGLEGRSWAEYAAGRPFTPRHLAQLLEGVRIKAKQIVLVADGRIPRDPVRAAN